MPSCPQCSGAVEPGDAFCGVCGASLDATSTSPTCPKCSAITAPEDQYCGSCGAALAGSTSVDAASPDTEKGPIQPLAPRTWPIPGKVFLLTFGAAALYVVAHFSNYAGRSRPERDLVFLYAALVGVVAAFSFVFDRRTGGRFGLAFCFMFWMIVAQAALSLWMPSTRLILPGFFALLGMLLLSRFLFRTSRHSAVAQPQEQGFQGDSFADFLAVTLVALVAVFLSGPLFRDTLLVSVTCGLSMGAVVWAMDAVHATTSVRPNRKSMTEYAAIAISGASYVLAFFFVRDSSHPWGGPAERAIAHYPEVVLTLGLLVITLLIASARKRQTSD